MNNVSNCETIINWLNKGNQTSKASSNDLVIKEPNISNTEKKEIIDNLNNQLKDLTEKFETVYDLVNSKWLYDSIVSLKEVKNALDKV
jgi:hypothetical protein